MTHRSLFLLFAVSLPLAAQPTLGGCPVFPSNNVWNTPIDKLPVAGSSSTYINTIGASRTLHADVSTSNIAGGGIPFAVVPAGQSAVAVTFDYADESDPGPYPIPAKPLIEAGTDHHILLLQSDTCKLFELFGASQQANGSWHAGSGAIFDLKSNNLRPDTWTSADAAGLPILPGLIRYDEVAAGVINHALRLTIPQTRKAHIWPARHDASSSSDPSLPPMGQRFRLQANFDISSFPADAQVVLTALKRYGMIVSDNGTSWYITGAPDSRWNLNTITQINSVIGANLEAVDTSSMEVSPDSGQAKGASVRTDVPFSPAPAFDLSLNQVMSLTLTGDVGSASVLNLVDGGTYTFLICQDANGNRQFTWPANVLGGMTINPAPGKCSAQQFVSDGVLLYATSPGSSNM